MRGDNTSDPERCTGNEEVPVPHPSDEPIRAYRRAQLVVDNGRVCLAPIYLAGTFPAAGTDARCHAGGTHPVPEPGCVCGWYSTATRAGLDRALDGPYSHWADLTVELSGKVVVHKNGYRAEHQRVLDVTLAAWCVHCGAVTGTYTTVRDPGHAGADRVVPVCARHLRRRRPRWTRADIANDLCCDIRVADTSAPTRPNHWHRYRTTTVLFTVTSAIGIAWPIVTVAAVTLPATWNTAKGTVVGLLCGVIIGAIPSPGAHHVALARTFRRRLRILSLAAAVVACGLIGAASGLSAGPGALPGLIG